MVKLLIILLCVTFLFSSCEQKENPKYYWVEFDKRYEKSDTNQIFHFNQTNSADSIKLSYFSKLDTINYILVKSNRDSSLITGYYTQHGHLRPLLDTSILLSQETYSVTVYIFNEFVTDGASLHYYEPTIGIYAIHSSTWPGITYLQTTDSLVNNKIKRLMKATIPEFFIRGQLAEELK